MLFTVVAVAVGLGLGFLTGGRFRHLGDRTFRGWPLLALGLLLQAGSALVDGGSFALLCASYAALLLFAAANVRAVGMWLVTLGLGLNALTIAVNGGMPVRRDAVVAAGIARAEDVEHVRIGGKRHLERPDDRLMLISDIIPVPALREVLSFGDLIMSVGVADVIVHLLRPTPARVRAST